MAELSGLERWLESHNKSIFFTILGEKLAMTDNAKPRMVISAGFEPATSWFDPDSEASRILHSAGVTKISGKKPVSAYVPADIAVQLARMAERPA